MPLRRPEKGKPSHFVDWVNRRRYASPNLKRGRQQISFILDQSFRRVSTPFPQIALLAATRFRDRTGTDLEISSSRLYHLGMASSASSEVTRRPSDTPKCSAAQISLKAGTASVPSKTPRSRRRPPRPVRQPNRRSDPSQRHHISRGDFHGPHAAAR